MQVNSKHHIIIIPASSDPQNLETVERRGKKEKNYKELNMLRKKKSFLDK